MKAKVNCWEAMQCGREPGGARVAELGPCPAATYVEADGFLGGKNGGRACAYIAGTFCGGQVQGSFADKQESCFECDFYTALRQEHVYDLNVLAFHTYVNEKRLKPAS